MTLETIFALLLLALSVQILWATRRTNNQLLQSEAQRATKRFEDNGEIGDDCRYISGVALLRNKKTGELRFINQKKLSAFELLAEDSK